MKKIKNKKSSPIQIKTPQSQITTLWNSPVSTVLVGFFFFFVFFFLFLFLPQIGLSVSPPPFFHFLLSPSILVLSLLELSLSLDFAQTQTQTHMPQAPLSNQWVSLFGNFFFFMGFYAYGVANLPWWGGGCGFVGICVVEVWVCGLAWWRVWVCGDQRLWWSFGDSMDQS